MMSVGSVHVGSIHIGYDLDESGEPVTFVTVEGDMPLVTQLGLLRLAEGTVIEMAMSEDDEEGPG